MEEVRQTGSTLCRIGRAVSVQPEAVRGDCADDEFIVTDVDRERLWISRSFCPSTGSSGEARGHGLGYFDLRKLQKRFVCTRSRKDHWLLLYWSNRKNG